MKFCSFACTSYRSFRPLLALVSTVFFRFAFRSRCWPFPRKCRPSVSTCFCPVVDDDDASSDLLVAGESGLSRPPFVFAALDVRRRRCRSAYELRWLRGRVVSECPSPVGTARMLS